MKQVKLARFTCGLGFLLMLGTAAATDAGNLSICAAAGLLLTGLGMMLVGGLLGGLFRDE